jgi:hypothetical protein
MVFRVQEFRAQMNYDGARPNLFKCDLTFPTTITGGSGAQNKFSFMARAAQMPGSTVNQIPQFYFGRELKFAGNRSFPEWTVTVINDEDFLIRDAFERWMSGLNSHVGNFRNTAFERGDGGYQQDGFITQFAKTGEVIKKYKFVGLFPIDLSPIELDWGANDTIEEYAVTFAYQWWEWAAGENGPTTDAVSVNVPFSPLLPGVP